MSGYLSSSPPRGNGGRKNGRSSPLPSYSSAIREKSQMNGNQSAYFTTLYFPIPGVPSRQLKAPIPIPPRLYHATLARFGRKRGCTILCFGVLLLLWTLFALTKRFGSEEKAWPTPFTGEAPTLVFARKDLQNVWEWEVLSGHYPSSRKIPLQIGLRQELDNPALPPLSRAKIPSKYRPPPTVKSTVTSTRGTGSKRVYLDIQSRPPNLAYPPRPVPGSIADLDIVMDHCDFTYGKYVRDCLEVLRLGAGLNAGNQLRRGKMDDWKYIYLEQGESSNDTTPVSDEPAVNPWAADVIRDRERNGAEDPNAGLTKKRGGDWEPSLELPERLEYTRYEALPDHCDPEHPRIFHMFWTGPFTDKPYLALLSYLYTQNLGMELPPDHQQSTVCRPQFWLWINPGPAASVPNPNARRDMFEQLKSNPWASPFLHPRFKDIIMFKMWNTTEQLDNVPELKEEWRALQDSLFNSGGDIIKVPVDKKSSSIIETEVDEEPDLAANATGHPDPSTIAKAENDDMVNRLGSKSMASYDRLSVILSDMARFVLCHRFGGIYLDADTIFLRDWEELWGWKGAFAYRWSRLEKYNTAVLHLNKGSALGTFLFRTALRNLLDFHPMTVSRYTKDAYLEGLLLRLPDALFDSAWLNTEYYQIDRPAQPYFTTFADFFNTPQRDSAAPGALGLDGFFKGAYSYHFHNSWWTPFDPSRNWPDLGPRFIKGERIAREQLRLEALKSAKGKATLTSTAGETRDTADHDELEFEEDSVANDKRDLDWSTVLKRTFEGFVRGEQPNLYGEWIQW